MNFNLTPEEVVFQAENLADYTLKGGDAARWISRSGFSCRDRKRVLHEAEIQMLRTAARLKPSLVRAGAPPALTPPSPSQGLTPAGQL